MTQCLLVSTLLLAFASLAGCNSSTVSNPDLVVFPDSNVSYRSQVQLFLGLRCMPCHDDNNAAGGIRLNTYSHLMFDRPNLIVQGDPNQSLVVLVLEQQVVHTSGNLQNIPSAQIRGVRTWVAEGAKNN